MTSNKEKYALRVIKDWENGQTHEIIDGRCLGELSRQQFTEIGIVSTIADFMEWAVCANDIFDNSATCGITEMADDMFAFAKNYGIVCPADEQTLENHYGILKAELFRQIEEEWNDLHVVDGKIVRGGKYTFTMKVETDCEFEETQIEIWATDYAEAVRQLPDRLM